MHQANQGISSSFRADPPARAITQITLVRNPSRRCNFEFPSVNSIRMTAAQADLQIHRPTVADGAVLWRIARDSKVLDLNWTYGYLQACRAFGATPAVARDGRGGPTRFVPG